LKIGPDGIADVESPETPTKRERENACLPCTYTVLSRKFDSGKKSEGGKRKEGVGTREKKHTKAYSYSNWGRGNSPEEEIDRASRVSSQ